MPDPTQSPPTARRLPPAAHRHGALALVAPALALAGCGREAPDAVASTAQGLTVTADFELDAPVLEPASTLSGDVSVAFNGTEHLAAWIDTSGVVMVTRITTAGVVRDPQGVVLGPAATGTPAVASDGAGFLVAWTTPTVGQVRAARLDAAGVVLDPGGFVVTASAARTATPVAAGSAAGYLVAWRDGRNAATTGMDYFASRIGRDGAVLDPAGRPVLVAPGDQSNASVAAGASGWLLVCEDAPSPDLRFGRLDASGAALDGAGRRVAVTARSRSAASVAFNGSNYLLAWSDRTSSGSLTPGIYAQVISPSGAVVGAEVNALVSGSNGTTTLASDGTAWLARGRIGSEFYSVQVAGTGVAAATARTPALPDVGGRLALSGRGGAAGYLLVYSARGMNPGGLRIASDGAAVGSAFEMNFRANLQQTPGVAFDGTGFLVTWADSRAGAAGWRARRVSPTGARLGASPTVLATIASGLVAASDGTTTLALWHDIAGIESRTLTAPITPAGAVGPATVIDVGSGITTRHSPMLTPGAGGYLAAWTSWQGSGGDGRFAVRAYPLTAAGAPRGAAPVGLSSAGRSNAAPGLSFDGANFLVSWVESPRTGSPSVCNSPVVALVTPAGDRLAATPTAVSAATCDAYATASASDGASHLVAWTSPAGVFAARVSPSGALLDATPRVLSSIVSDSPTVAFDGASFVVGWRRGADATSDLYVARVSPSGEVLDPGGVPVANEPIEESGPRLASTRTGRTLVMYSRRMSASAVRVRGRFVTFDDAGVTDAGPHDVPPIDSGAIDSGAIDSGAIDSPVFDAGPLDSTGSDAAVTPDTAVLTDRGTPTDSVSVVDAPSPDSGAAADAGAPAPPVDEGGCSTAPSRRGSPAWAMLLGALALLSRTRRHRGE